MLKIKSKAILAFTGLMVAALMFTGTVSADMVTLPAAGVSKTSSMSNIQALQTFLNWTLGAQITPLVVDGVYGAKTTAAIKMFQSQNGLSADGKFGPISAAKAMALQANMGGVNYPAGCASNSGFSSTTGQPCAGGALPAGCTSTAGFSSTTGIPCSTNVGTNLPAGCASAAGFSTTTGAPCTGGTVVSGTNGYLADVSSDSSNRVSTVYESEQDKVVAGFRATARLASQNVDRVRVTFKNTDAGSSSNLSKYISGASLWYGSTKIATMSTAQADRTTSDDTYTFNFSGLNAVIAKDQIGRFYVSVSANGSMDSADTDSANWTVTFVAGGVSATSPDGSSDTYPSTSIVQTGLSFGKFSSNGVKAEVNLSSNNPSASILTVQNTSATNNVNLLKFTVKATNSDLNLRKVPVQVTVVGASTPNTIDAGHVINTLKLYRGTDLVDSVDGSAGIRFVGGSPSNPAATACATGVNTGDALDASCTYFFSNLSNPANYIATGTSAEFTVVADFKQVSGNYTEGTTVTAALVNADVIRAANFSIQDTNGDQLTDMSTSIRVGGGVGETMTLRVNGVMAVMGAPSYTSITDGAVTEQVTYNIPVAVTAIGNTAYIGTTVEKAVTSTIGNGSGAFAYVFQDAAAPTLDSVNETSTATFTCNATLEGGTGYRLDAGTTKNCVIQVILTVPNPVTPTSYRVALKTIASYAVAALTGTETVSTLLPVQNFQTGYQFITQ